MTMSVEALPTPDLRPALPLTPSQAKLLAYLEAFWRERGYPPTLREICSEFRIASTNGAHEHLKALERKGFVARTTLVSRGLRILRSASSAVVLPPRKTRATTKCANCGADTNDE